MSEAIDSDPIQGRKKTNSITSPTPTQSEKSTTLPDLERRKAVVLAKDEDPICRLMLTPRERYDIPITSQMAYGWFHTPDKIPKNWSRWRRPILSSDISLYSDAYCRMTGVSPCVRKLNSTIR